MEKWRTGHMMWHATTTIVFWMYLLCRFCSFLLYNFCVVYIKVTFFFFAFFFILHLCMSVFVLARFDFVFLTFASLSRQCAWRDTQNLLIQIVSPIWATHTVHEEHTAQHSTSNTQHTHMTCTTGKLYHTFAVADSRSGLLDVPERTGWEECFRLLFEYECSALYI